MRRTAAVLTAGCAFLTMLGCGGGGGGDEGAFCDDLDALSGQIADGDLSSNNGLGKATDTANSLFENASDDQKDAVSNVGEALADADPEDAAQTAELIQDELGDFADDCDIELASAPEEETTTTTEAPDDDTTTSSTEPSVDTTDGGDGGDLEVNARQPIPADFEADEDLAAAQACFDGDPAACDSLFLSTAVGSVAEDYGSTCAGRVADGTSGGCSDLITGPQAVPADVVDTANAQACFDGNMVACDDQFRAAAAGSADQTYGGLCGGRVQNTTAFCVDIFGEQALN